jgi:hypothetical protein
MWTGISFQSHGVRWNERYINLLRTCIIFYFTNPSDKGRHKRLETDRFRHNNKLQYCHVYIPIRDVNGNSKISLYNMAVQMYDHLRHVYIFSKLN